MLYSFLIAGVCFLFNPTVNVVDPLPDFIGYLLIVIGLTRASCLIDRLADARRLFLRLSIITAVKLFSSVFLVFSDDTFTLVLVFSFAVIELMCIYPSFGKLFDGLFYSGSRYDGTAVFSSRTIRRRISKDRAKKLVMKGCDGILEETELESGKTVYIREKTVDRAQSLKFFTMFFMTLKLALTVIPELTALQLYNKIGGVAQGTVNYSEFKPLFLAFSWAVTLAFGIPWLVRMIVYLASIMRDKTYIESMKTKYDTDIATDETRRIVNSMGMALALAGCAVVLTFDLYIDHVNCIPNFIAATFMLAAFLLLTRYCKLAAVGAVMSCGWGVLSALNMGKQIAYFDKYTLQSVFYRTEALDAYDSLKTSMALEFALAMLTYVILAVVLVKSVGKHIDILDAKYHYSGSEAHGNNREIRFTVNSRSTAIAVIAVISMICSAIYPFVVTDFEFALPIVMGVQLIFIAYTVYSLVTVNDEVYGRLRYDY